MKNVYTIPSGISFVDALAKGLLDRTGGDLFKLANGLILLPTRRSCRALREAFLRQIGTSSALLPRMQPLGDLDEEELYFAPDLDLDPSIPPAISPLRRQLLLMQLIAAKEKDMPLDQAAQLAKALGDFLDQVQTERSDLSKLASLVEKKDLAEHWQQTVKFLEVLTNAWPAVLAAEGCIDPAERQNRVMEAQCVAWRKKPPGFPVIAAGTTGSLPSTADFLDCIASMPGHCVILPGLDRDLSEEAWQQIEESHPQYGMKQLIEKFGMRRDEVKVWPGSESVNTSRLRLIQTSMLPAGATGAWQHLKKSDFPKGGFQGLTRIELGHPQEEAQTIALLMRAVLEESATKTATLVTPDRNLAGRVLALLKRWGIEANDSAGAPLVSLPVGAFLIGILAASSPHASPVDMLSLLKHPLAACGLDPAECRMHAREVELNVWRQERPEVNEWLNAFRRALQPLTSSWNKPLPLLDRLLAHIKLAETIATSMDESGMERLWRGEGGEAAASWFDDWRKAAGGFPSLSGDEYQSLFLELMRAVRVRPHYGQHPRLRILGPLEARLIQSDMTIIGGLNEGVWPPEAPIDPWMSRPMRKDFGLPSPERRIGLSAHDFVQLASAPEVIMTRAKRAGNAPTVPSRFLLQLETVLEALNHSSKDEDALEPLEPWDAWARLMDRPEKIVPCAPPEPRPPKASRPTQLSVTEIGTWRRNPYAIYAKHILGLVRLDPLETEIDAADRGMLIHDALEKFMKVYGKNLPKDALEKLLAAGRKVFAEYDEHPEVKAFWWPRFERIAAWFIETEQARNADGKKLLQTEAKGSIAIGDFTLQGRADRIDVLPNGQIEIVDYKTGSVPSQKDIKAGYEPQLPLLALIAAQGGFPGIDAKQVSQLSYWKLSGGRKVADIIAVKDGTEKLVEEAHTGLEKLIEIFANAKTPYQAVPKPKLTPRYDDYAHLARLAEWGRTGGEE